MDSTRSRHEGDKLPRLVFEFNTAAERQQFFDAIVAELYPSRRPSDREPLWKHVRYASFEDAR